MAYPVIPDVPGATQSDPLLTGVKVDVKSANTPATLFDNSEVSVLSPNNTGLPVNVPVIVQKANAVSTGSVASLAKAFTSNNVAGNSIVVVAGCGNGTAMTVADSAGNTYTSAVRANVSTTFEAQIFYTTGIVAGANTVTVTNAGTAASMAVEIYEVSGLLALTVAQPDTTSSGTSSGGSATASTSNISAASPNSLAFLGVGIGTGAQNITANGSWTADGGTNGLVPTTPVGLFQFNSFSQLLSTTTPVVASASVAGGGEPWAAVSAIFKPVVLGIQGTVTLAGYNYTNITTQTTTLIKTGAGILHSIIINSHAASATIEMDDALTHTTPKIGTITLPSTITAVIPISLEYDVQFSTGLSVTTGAANADITVVWK